MKTSIFVLLYIVCGRFRDKNAIQFFFLLAKIKKIEFGIKVSLLRCRLLVILKPPREIVLKHKNAYVALGPLEIQEFHLSWTISLLKHSYLFIMSYNMQLRIIYFLLLLPCFISYIGWQFLQFQTLKIMALYFLCNFLEKSGDSL